MKTRARLGDVKQRVVDSGCLLARERRQVIERAFPHLALFTSRVDFQHPTSLGKGRASTYESQDSDWVVTTGAVAQPWDSLQQFLVS